MNMITTLLQPHSGSLKVLGLDVVAEADAVRQRIGLAPEEPALFSGLSAAEFVKLSASLHGMDDRHASRATAQWLEIFELENKSNEMLGSFSKGMKRKTLIAACLVHDPDLMVLDEPLDGLDIFAQKILKDMLLAAAARGKTVIYSTHILETVEGFCSHVGLLQEGKVLAHGPVADVMAQLEIKTLGAAFSRRGR